MKRREFLSLSAVGAFSVLPAVRADDVSNETMKAAARIIQKEVDAGRLESAVLHVQHGSKQFVHSFGKAPSGDAIFLLASITKTMTAAGVMLLADRGELRLSDRVMKFIPEFSTGERKEITIEQLLVHTSGLPDQLPENSDLRKRHAPLSDFVKAAIKTPLLFPPGTKYKYQSMGLLLAAEIVERITRTPFPDFLAKEVFKPLGMNRTALGLGRIKLSNTIRCQTESAAPESGAGSAEAKKWDWNSPYWRNLGAPWGGAHGSAPDVTRFLRSFLQPDGKVLRKETARAMIRNHTKGLGAKRGLGFAVGPAGFSTHCSERTFGHSGATGTIAWADPKTDTSCVILTSLPSGLSGKTILKPVSDVVAEAVKGK